MYLPIEEPAQKISPAIVSIWRITNSIGHGILLVIFAALLYADHFFDWRFWIGWIIWGAAILTVASAAYSILIEPAFLQRTWRYEVDKDYIQLKHGYFEVVYTIIPLTKVEYVTTHQGPFLRKHGLYSLRIGTVTSSHQIPAIPKEKALALRAQIAFDAKLKDSDEEMAVME